MHCPRCEHVHKTTTPCECHCHIDPTWTGEGMGKTKKIANENWRVCLDLLELWLYKQGYWFPERTFGQTLKERGIMYGDDFNNKQFKYDHMCNRCQRLVKIFIHMCSPTECCHPKD